MHHEHTGNCCGQLEHLGHEQLHQVVEHLGSLGCNGHCHHPEHQLMRSFVEEQERMFSGNEDEDEDEQEYVNEYGIKVRRKKSQINTGHLLRLSEV